MVSSNTTFSAFEVRKFLEEDGYFPGTPAFCEEMDRRYWPTEVSGYYTERDDWQGDRKKFSGEA